jgi:hypothetical protein
MLHSKPPATAALHRPWPDWAPLETGARHKRLAVPGMCMHAIMGPCMPIMAMRCCAACSRTCWRDITRRGSGRSEPNTPLATNTKVGQKLQLRLSYTPAHLIKAIGLKPSVHAAAPTEGGRDLRLSTQRSILQHPWHTTTFLASRPMSSMQTVPPGPASWLRHMGSLHHSGSCCAGTPARHTRRSQHQPVATPATAALLT